MLQENSQGNTKIHKSAFLSLSTGYVTLRLIAIGKRPKKLVLRQWAGRQWKSQDTTMTPPPHPPTTPLDSLVA